MTSTHKTLVLDGVLKLWSQEGGYANDAIVIGVQGLDSVIRDHCAAEEPDVDLGRVRVTVEWLP